MTTSATATTVDSDSQSRCGMLLMLIVVTAATCRIASASFSSARARSAIFSRMALSAGNKPVTSPAPASSATAASDDAGRQRQRRDELYQAVAHRQDRCSAASASPGSPPMQREQHRIRRAPAQDARAGEAERLQHADLARAFAHRHRPWCCRRSSGWSTNAAPTTRPTISAMLPSCAANALLNAFSVSVAVSSAELANIASMALATWSLSRRRGGRSTIQPISVLVEGAGLVEIVVLDEHEVGLDLRRAAGEDADDGEVPGVRAVLLGEDVAGERDAVADLPSPFGAPCVSPTSAPVRRG